MKPNLEFRDGERAPINIHPDVRTKLAHLLCNHPDLQSTGIGYSELIDHWVMKEWEALKQRQEAEEAARLN